MESRQRPRVTTMQNAGERGAEFQEAELNLERISAADVVVGIPTYNNRETVGSAAEAGLRGLTDGFSGAGRAVIVNADGGSRDGTVEYLRQVLGQHIPLVQVEYPLYALNRFSAPPAGVPGRTEAAMEIFRTARRLGAKACALMDPEVDSVEPNWTERLVRPILDGKADLIVPTYRRHKLDGLINSGILSPFVRALYGMRLRQPAGAELGFSARLMDFYLNQAGGEAQASPTMDPWSTAPAAINGFRVGQSFLGPRLVHPRAVPRDLGDILQQVLTEMFEQMEQTAAFWQKVRGSEAAPSFGPPAEIEAEGPDFDRKPMIDSFWRGSKDLIEIWRLIFPPATLLDLRRMERQPDGEVRFSDELWARIVYDFALGYHLRTMRREHLLQAFTPLYMGWAASFTGEMRNASGTEVEARLERLSMQFEIQKKYLISRWRWPDRFNP
jgi:hypothetical protein